MIYLGSDHAGFILKKSIKKILDELGEKYEDLGNALEDPADDYPDYAFKVGEAVGKKKGSYGILSCGSAQGVCIAANKVKGVRAAYAVSHEEAQKVREHNDANILCLSGWKQNEDEIRPILATFLGTQFMDEERHVRRIEKISKYEGGK
jgi:ribose 5-phosphate isomerase B